MLEHHFQCPYCWEEVSMLLDPSFSGDYIEDCEVCCHPIEIKVEFVEKKLIGFSSNSLEH